jgi:hypothetical protein
LVFVDTLLIGGRDYVGEDPFFKILAENQVSFYDPTAADGDSQASVPPMPGQ